MKTKVKEFFEKQPHAKIKVKELARKVGANSAKKYAELKEALFFLAKEDFVVRRGKRFEKVKSAEKKLMGVFQLSKEGTYAFVILKKSKLSDIFIPEKHFGLAFHGDMVEVKLLPNKKGKNLEGQVVKIIERKNDKIIGTLIKQKKLFFVEPRDKSIQRNIFIDENELNGAKVDDLVEVVDIILSHRSSYPEGIIGTNFGAAGSFNAEISSIAKEFEITTDFPPQVEKEVNNISHEITEEEIAKRLDLRAEVIFTIDPADAKDFDDAVSVKKLENGNLSIGIHIADVSHYVSHNSKVYEEALKRATSVYLVGIVIPMLPEKLSNNLCSLVPNKDRLAYSVIVEFNSQMGIENYQIKKSIINSKRRFTYEEVQEIIENGNGDFHNEITQLNKIAKYLRSERNKNGSINFTRPEVKFELDKNGKPISINIKTMKESNQLIEELMLLANRIVAGHFNKGDKENPKPFVYRIHDKPDETKLNEFVQFVNSLGYKFNTSSKNLSKEFQQLLVQAEGTKEEAVLNEIAIRTMAKAVYSPKNIGHYGLGFPNYSHFTSPIRRFPDLIVHLLTYNYLENNDNHLYPLVELFEICDHASAQERNAVSAERLSIKLKQMEFLKDKLGNDYEGIISGVTNFGLFIEVTENLAEGLVRMRDLDDDYYEFDEKNYSLVGRRNNRAFRLGDKVTVKLIRVDEEKREVDFLIVE
jgi:ribonuclease R